MTNRQKKARPSLLRTKPGEQQEENQARAAALFSDFKHTTSGHHASSVIAKASGFCILSETGNPITIFRLKKPGEKKILVFMDAGLARAFIQTELPGTRAWQLASYSARQLADQVAATGLNCLIVIGGLPAGYCPSLN